MVNYCCVYGCGRNSKTSKHLYYYSLPKEKHRLLLWLEVIGRKDLIEKTEESNLTKLTHRVCSRHFSPSSINNKHLCRDAVPSLSLPGSFSEDPNEKEDHESAHISIICNSCNKSIQGFRYKCITCPDYDICSKCEMFEAHPQHYVLRIPTPIKFSVADDLVKKWKQLLKAEKGADSSDDDIPITKYARNYDSSLDLCERERAKIRNEVTRVLNIKHVQTPATRKRAFKKIQIEKVDDCIETDILNSELESITQEVVFADVNDIKGNQIDVEDEIPNNITPLPVAESGPRVLLHNMKLNDVLSEFLIGVKYP